MVDTSLIEKAIEKSGKTKTFIAKQMGISIQTLRNKCLGKYDLTSNEIEALCNQLSITKLEDKEKIFFSK